ncbi:50S ribosomal protein L35 [Nocardia terpenica]|uniref:Large ribosomal subunit protein bL35 n=1 Tax=Nocardia terpenica TaxID=455432 RepID=A0A164MS20_9NOCA|nr:50S ribosomal protein L35 [Nocardia terpenica]KZM73611.1 50S ribosomal protein L35 [Nocardia terpenica]MBF6066372.1 50S ribosomal protein L35 [Nocardia terpenica]MBF6109438.1 50S ribosomal protein L35 [Nocardia terpenica]MBF6116619.1 50S ribosomal protein L35 [Nocardia terpenica]MBF6123854.1 50S ribosomal protein L35 [Nocardia terpenica]
MPKMKSHGGASKRFKVTGRGKLLRQQAKNNHNFEHRSSRETRRVAGKEVVAKADVPRIKKMLGI